jgi:hypothetical protein
MYHIHTTLAASTLIIFSEVLKFSNQLFNQLVNFFSNDQNFVNGNIESIRSAYLLLALK